MKYTKRKKNKEVNAVKLTKFADVDIMLKDCPHVQWVWDIDGRSGEKDWFVEFVNDGVFLIVGVGEYLVWNDIGAWVMDADKFEKKYESTGFTIDTLVSTSTNSGYVKGPQYNLPRSV